MTKLIQTKNREVEKLVRMVKTKSTRSALQILSRLVERYPNVGIARLEYGFFLDRLGRESEAIPQYEAAIRAGLPRAKMIDAMICLGSSLDTVGNSSAAVVQLQRAKSLFPNEVTVDLFLAAALSSVDRPLSAVRILASRLLLQSRSRRVNRYKTVVKRKLNIRVAFAKISEI